MTENIPDQKLGYDSAL